MPLDYPQFSFQAKHTLLTGYISAIDNELLLDLAPGNRQAKQLQLDVLREIYRDVEEMDKLRAAAVFADK